MQMTTKFNPLSILINDKINALVLSIKQLFKIGNRSPVIKMEPSAPVIAYEPDVVIRRAYGAFRDIEDTALFKEIIKEAQYSRGGWCPQWTERTGKLPEVMQCKFINVVSRERDLFRTTYWVLWYENGDVRVLTPNQNKGIYSTNNIELFINDPADKMPVGVTKAAQVTIGVKPTENGIRGVQWQLYQQD